MEEIYIKAHDTTAIKDALICTRIIVQIAIEKPVLGGVKL